MLSFDTDVLIFVSSRLSYLRHRDGGYMSSLDKAHAFLVPGFLVSWETGFSTTWVSGFMGSWVPGFCFVDRMSEVSRRAKGLFVAVLSAILFLTLLFFFFPHVSFNGGLRFWLWLCIRKSPIFDNLVNKIGVNRTLLHEKCCKKGVISENNLS